MKIKGEYIIRDVAGESVAIPIGGTVLESNIIVALNSSGRFLWELLVKGGTEEELTAAMCGEYDTEPETARADILEFAEYLKRNKVEIE